MNRQELEERRRVIVERYRAGETPKAIAADLDVTTTFVRRVARRAGVPAQFPGRMLSAERARELARRSHKIVRERRSTEERDKAIRASHARGVHSQEIALQHGLTRVRVDQIVYAVESEVRHAS